MDLPQEIISNIKSYIYRDRDQKSPTAKIIKDYFDFRNNAEIIIDILAEEFKERGIEISTQSIISLLLENGRIV